MVQGVNMHRKHHIPRGVVIGGILAVAMATYLPLVRAATADTELRVEVTGLKSSQGDIIVALYNSPKGYTDHPYKTYYANIDNNKCEWVMKGLPRGEYAVILVHDENGNHHMDRNFVGFPKEPYAFSNNVKAHLHAPPFSDTKFSLKDGETLVKITLE